MDATVPVQRTAHPFCRNSLVIAEEAAAVRGAEASLAELVVCWPDLSVESRPVALRYAVFDLVICHLADPTRAQIFFDEVAAMLNMSRADLERRVVQRAKLVERVTCPAPSRHYGQRKTFLEELYSWLLS